MSEIVENLTRAKREYESAMARRGGVGVAKERIRNLLFNYFDQLLSAYIENKSLHEEVEALDTALREADEELKKTKKPKRGDAGGGGQA